ncbi:MAG: hypothetical protein KC444_06960 [Nitrosopumilus sp.]|nr:hypothetical protein [Nitrosopumilus sp.]
MPSFKSQYAYPLMYYMLSHKQFKQRQMARELGYRHGGSISGFVNWLEELRMVEKTKDTLHRTLTYKVPSPPSLVKFYSNFRKMSDLRITRDMGDDRNAAIEFFKRNNGVFCLTSALEHYTEYIRDPAIHVYVDESYWNEMAKKETEGKVRVNFYAFKPYREDNIIEINGMKLTTQLRTLIDLYCDDKAYAAEPLIKKLWT